MILDDEGDDWHVIDLKMEAEDGTTRSAASRASASGQTGSPSKQVEEAKRDPRVWASLYQQRPAPETGDFFRRAWLHPVPRREMPPRQGAARLRRLGLRDDARRGGDFTVHMVVGIDPDDRPWLLDIWRERASAPTSGSRPGAGSSSTTPAQLGRGARPDPQPASGPSSSAARASCTPITDRQQFTSRFDKAIRAQSLRGYIATMGFGTPRTPAGARLFEHELLTFPAARHDDMVDALGLVGQLLDFALHGRAAQEREQQARARLQSHGARNRRSYRS